MRVGVQEEVAVMAPEKLGGALRGFGSHLETEAVAGALPRGQNNPQKCPLGLYAECISGSAFTEPRATNLSSWLYRILPSVVIGRYSAPDHPTRGQGITRPSRVTPERLLWTPPEPRGHFNIDFVDGLQTIAGQGDPAQRDGVRIYTYIANISMENSCFCNADGDLLVVPQLGRLRIVTEMGILQVEPGWIFVVPRGIKFRVELLSPDLPFSRGYVCEVFNRHFELPERGLIGANGLASERDFCYPEASFEDKTSSYEVVTKFQGEIFESRMERSPFDVVAWHGNYAPYCYNLADFCPVNSVLFDHMDPSIFTVLSCRSATPGVALVDFVIFPPRWLVQEHTFRPPYFHRNCMTEFMGLIRGAYDAKEGARFRPGGFSLHSIGSPHGPDVTSFNNASEAKLQPHRMDESALAFMFETCLMLKVSSVAHDCGMSDLAAEQAIEREAPSKFKLVRDETYPDCWQGFPVSFKRPDS